MIPSSPVKKTPTVVLSTLQPKYPHELLEPMQYHIDYTDTELQNGFQFEVKIRDRPRNKVNPTLRLASPKDAPIIVSIVKEDYEGTYPYKEMEDPGEVKRMIESGRYKFVVFLDDEDHIIGTTCFVLNFEEKTGYTRTFVVKKEWLGVLDATKAYVASFAAICNRYKERIHLWWGEARTADAKSQYINRLCSFRPIGFLPNKDFFYNQVESDVVIASYNKEMFSEHRSLQRPNILPEVLHCYTYTDLQYDLGPKHIVEPDLDIKAIKTRAKNLQDTLEVSMNSDRYNYITYRLSLNQCESFFSFLYTPKVNNFEKVKYNVESLEELWVFVDTYRKYVQKLGVRYMESYVSAYTPAHQKVFLELGFTPRGYLPAWKFNKITEMFEDRILFNWYRGPLVRCKMIPEGSLLLKCLNTKLQ